MLDHSIFGFFDRYREMNNILSEFGYFLDFMKEETSFDFNLGKN